MGWFSKKNKTQEMSSSNSYNDVQELPSLPDLPDLSNNYPDEHNDINPLPILPSNTLGQKFNEKIIKDSIGSDILFSGGPPKGTYSKEIDEDYNVELKKPNFSNIQLQEFKLPPPPKIETPKMELIPPPQLKNINKPKSETKEVPKEFVEAAQKVKSSQPVFIRIDKFQKALEIIDETHEKISEMKKNLNEIKKIRDEEDLELQTWDSEISKLKEKIEKIDEDLFSRVE